MFSLKYSVYRFLDTKSYDHPNYEIVLTNLSKKQAMNFIKEQPNPSDYLVQPYSVEEV